MTPQLYYTIFNTRAGWTGLLGSEAGLRRVTLPQPTEVKAIALLGEGLKEAKPSPTFFSDLIKRFQAYYSGKPVVFKDKLDLDGATPFQRSIWEAARKIPYGKTHTYTWIATQAGKPRAARAAGQALGQNPCPIIVPCHRVTCTGGGPGGFNGGLAAKNFLLKLERNRHESRQEKHTDRQLTLDIS